jgi:arylformamidase
LSIRCAAPAEWPLTVSGHSAGAHLATFLFTEDQPPNIRAALLLGGLFRLEPLRSSFLQAEITLTDEEVVAFTPMTHSHQPTTRVSILVGADETTPFHEQADEFAQKLAKDGLDVVRAEIPLRNHMDSVRDLAVPGSNARNLLLDLLRQV